MKCDKKLDSLKNKAEFDFIYKNAKRFFHKNFVLFSQKLQAKSPHYKTQKILDSINGRNAELYLGLSISKKIGKACVRNLIKRRIRGIIYECQASKEVLGDRDSKDTQAWLSGVCLVFVAREGVVEADFQTLKKDMLFALRKLLDSEKGRSESGNINKGANKGKNTHKNLGENKNQKKTKNDHALLKTPLNTTSSHQAHNSPHILGNNS